MSESLLDLRGENDEYAFVEVMKIDTSEADEALRAKEAAATERRNRKMIAMAAIGGFTPKQIAARWELPAPTVSSIVSEYNEGVLSLFYMSAFCEETGQTLVKRSLTVEQVKEVKKLRKLGYDKTAIARYFGVCTNTVTGAINNA